MRHKTTQALYSYWNGLRGRRMAPQRFEIEPGSIGDLLPDTFILERRDAGTFPFRLAGTRLCERFKTEFRGRNFLASWNASDAATLTGRLNTISVQGGVIVVLAEAETATGKSVPIEVIILPLVHNQAIADRFLGAVSTLHQPIWLGFDPIMAVHILSDELVWPDGHPHQSDPLPPNAADRQIPFLPHLRTSRIVRADRRQFRVYDGGLANETAASPMKPTPPG
jgi:hypothetical protein